jgi:hypothetical protein
MYGYCLFASGFWNFSGRVFSQSPIGCSGLQSITGNGVVHVSRAGFCSFFYAISGKPNGFQTGADPFSQAGDNERPIQANREGLEMINRRQFLYHSHILEHRDMGMMRNYLVT